MKVKCNKCSSSNLIKTNLKGIIKCSNCANMQVKDFAKAENVVETSDIV